MVLWHFIHSEHAFVAYNKFKSINFKTLEGSVSLLHNCVSSVLSFHILLVDSLYIFWMLHISLTWKYEIE